MYDNDHCHFDCYYWQEGSDAYAAVQPAQGVPRRLGVNQQEMGTLVGVSRQTISQIERGDYSPSVTLALKLAKVCQVHVEDIFSYQEEERHET